MTSFSHYVFVDLENVPSIDLSVVAGKPIHVTLFLGKQQKSVDLALTQQIHRQADQVALVEVGASGRNALDLVLAAYLGRASAEHPDAEFVIVSKDKDFDPLIGHLRAGGRRVTRHADFLGPASRSARASPTATPKTPAAPRSAKVVVPANKPPATDKIGKLVQRMTSGAVPLPKNKARLLRHVSTHYGNKLSDDGIAAVVDDLIQRGLIVIDERDRVTYPQRQ
jgi:hypothetical protein